MAITSSAKAHGSVSLIKLAFKNLIRGSLRNLFTLSGVAAGIALFVALTSISYSLKQQIDQAMILGKVDIIVQEKGAATPVASRLPEALIPGLRNLPATRSVSPLTIGSVSISGPDTNLPYIFLVGINPSESGFPMAGSLESSITSGHVFQPGEDQILLGHIAANRLGVNVGDTVTIGSDAEYAVSGVYQLDQGFVDGGAMINLRHSQSLTKKQGYINLALVEAKDKKAVTPLLDTIPNALSGTSAIRAQSLRKQIRAVTMIDSFIGAVSTAAIILGGLMVLNTLLMAVAERTREIGVLMSIGWSKRMIMQLIVTESMLISLTGGILGYVLAFPTLKGLAMLPTTGPGWIPPYPSAVLFFAAMVVAFIIGGLSSLYPAIHATRMSPATALRYE